MVTRKNIHSSKCYRNSGCLLMELKHQWIWWCFSTIFRLWFEYKSFYMCWYQVERQRSIVFYFIVLNWKTTIVDSRKALYLSYFQNWFSTSMCQQSIMVFINLFSSNLLYRCVVPCLNRLTLVEGLNFQNNLASLNIQGALPLSIFVSIFIFFKNASVAIELLLI